MHFLLFKKNKYFFFFCIQSSLVLNYAIFKLSRNSRNKSHANIRCFTVVDSVNVPVGSVAAVELLNAVGRVDSLS